MRRVIITVLLVICSVTLHPSATSAGTGDAAASHRGSLLAKARVRVTLTTSTPWVKKGDDVSLKGQVKGARGRQVVRIMQRTKGSRSWVVEATKKTNRKGAFRHREDINTGDRSYKACVGGACSKPVTVRMGTPPKKSTSVAIAAVSPTTVEAGQAFTVSGSASSNLEGRTVQVEAYDSGTDAWSPIGSAIVRSGAWTGSASVSTAGSAVPLRASFAGGIGLARSSSTATSIAVYGWFHLRNRESVSDSNGLTGGSYNVNGVTYPQSVGVWFFSSRTSYVEYDLSRSCTRFAATVGVADYSPSDEKVAGALIVDNVTKWSRTGIGLGQSYPLDIDITAGLRLRIEGTPEVYGSDADLIFGDARVYCAP
ncbi:hypothetical protein F4692_000344 [Nocardioides cavernae]|uniref:Glycosyl hydrolase family 98 putative carbohydrate-binding module domain-containing protein n=1 Tax=Nocardioides cavernae TaxID=1921566 RepID=A0A7Y9GZK8_9ACTN|nr:NPCBM/NEW2 domain-containing protein [Nocardioides cavernae]NYE35240.1 hypothetical protein [Nocardioides cavernae]